MPRSFSRSIESRCWSVITRCDTVLGYSSSRSESVVLPWSTCAMMQKLRVYLDGIGSGSSSHVGEFGKAFHHPRFLGATRQATEHPAGPKFPKFRGARRGRGTHAVFP